MEDITSKTINFVKMQMAGQDGSHDWYHIERVMNLACFIADKEKVEDLECVKLVALLHDIDDWKYNTKNEDAKLSRSREWLFSQNYDIIKTNKIVDIIERVGFKNELALSWQDSLHISKTLPELAVVQDADRLDAIGAIGIARAFTYGGHKNQSLYIPGALKEKELTQDMYISDGKNNQFFTLQHFYDKLFKIKNLMKTTTGKKIAEERHQFMENYVEQFLNEWEGKY